MTDRRATFARVHLAAWAAWAGTLVVGLIASGGQTSIAVNDPAAFVGFGIAFASCMTLVSSAVAANLNVGGIRASIGPVPSAAAMLGAMLPAAWALAWTAQSGSESSTSPKNDAEQGQGGHA